MARSSETTNTTRAPRATSKANGKAGGKAASKSSGKAKAPAKTQAKSQKGSAGSLFEPVVAPTKVDYPLLENAIQRWWDERGMLQQYLHRNDHSERRYSFVDGPITANNPMGVHHAWGRAYKDLWQRFNTMRGYRQRYQNGFDCQGLWVEVEVEKELGFKSKRDIESYGIGRFVEKCKERVLRYSAEITAQSIRLGEWMDWDDSYYTMSDENNYTIWGFLKTCWEAGWIYRGRDVMPWCPRCATGISDMEINEGRREVTHTSVYVRFPLVDRPHEYLLVWTTTPWTLPANVAAAVNPELTYAKVEQDGDFYYLSEDVVSKLAKLRGHEHGEAKVVEKVPGSHLLGWAYTGPFDELPAWQAEAARNVRHHVIAWSDVSADEGTGVVHIAPGCGREDFALGKDEHLPALAPVDESGVYVDGYDWLTGMAVKEVARPIFESLRAKGYFYQTESYKHVYPHCWRCGTELIFRLVDEWFISMRDLRERMMRFVPDIRWIPGFGLDREMDWLRNMEDWMISKKRYWGLALPIYYCAACESFEVIGSETELHERAVEGWDEFAGHTPHRPWVDAVKIRCSHCGALVSRIPDVGNPWLDAGIVPFSTLKYRSDREYWREWFPAEFITESFPGQFRNWFYSMLVMSAALEDTEPFKTVLGFATLLDQNGAGMHKSLGNSIPFDEAAHIVGADSMRWLFLSHAPENNLRFPRIPTEEQAAQAREQGQPPRLSDLWMQARAPLDKLWNVYSFFVTYANIDQFNPLTRSLPVAERSDLDRWALSELQETVRTVTERLEDYDAEHASAAVASFIEDLSNWYVRRSRRRFWKAEEDSDKVAAYLTLYECMVTLTRLLAPFTPFLAESLYQNLVRSVDATAPESVHLADWPWADAALVNPTLRDETALVMQLVNLGRAAREQAQMRVRQPLATLYVTTQTEAEAESLGRLADQVLEELNVKRLEVLPRDSDMLTYTLKPRRSTLGPKYGKRFPALLAALAQADARQGARELRERGALSVALADGGEPVTLTADEVDVEAGARAGFVAAEERGYVVALDTTLTPELVNEGLMRDLTHFVQDARKKADLAIEDSIALWLAADAELAATIERFAASIKDETLARALTVSVGEEPSGAPASAYRETIPAARLGGHAVTLALVKR
ncbi:MAG TPA: isoleucine--tRNA ligase [Ktedonobacterales bacterium]|nr:isoleucine--tRNA ligase [Ktedonobacterales bacterium]